MFHVPRVSPPKFSPTVSTQSVPQQFTKNPPRVSPQTDFQGFPQPVSPRVSIPSSSLEAPGVALELPLVRLVDAEAGQDPGTDGSQADQRGVQAPGAAEPGEKNTGDGK